EDWKKKSQETKRILKCKGCDSELSGYMDTCPFCGLVLAGGENVREIIEHLDVKLVTMEDVPQEELSIRRDYFSGLVRAAKKLGKPASEVGFGFKKRFGNFPNDKDMEGA